MTNTVLPPAIAPAFTRLWVAVGILGVTTLAMGAALVQTHMQAAAQPQMQTVANAAPTLTPLMALKPEQVNALEEVLTTQPKTAAAHRDKARPAIKKIANDVRYRPAYASVSAPRPTIKADPVRQAASANYGYAQTSSPLVRPEPQVVCLHCGTVVAVTALQREPEQGSGVGAVAGAVLGGLLGNQFGGGDGKTIITVAGALGGGWAGNAVEKRMKKEVVYQIDMRMQDGSMRRLEQSTPAVVGDQVKVEAGVIRRHTV